MIRTRSTRLCFGRLVAGSVLSAAACSDGAGPTVAPAQLTPLHVLTLATYDGSGQAVHPDATATPLSWGGGAEQLFVTPYPNSAATLENPSLFSGGLLDWRVLPGVTNPIVLPPEIGFLSDPDQLFNPETNELWLYYRVVTTENEIFLTRASSPSTWSAPIMVASGANHSIISPSVVRRGPGDWLMWAVNSGPDGCGGGATTVDLRRSRDGINWSNALTTDLAEMNAFAWHIDVEWIPSRGEFWAVYNVKIPGSCATSALHFAQSRDGVHWVPAAGPVLQRGALPEFADIVYRGSLQYDQDSDTITLWYSGARYVRGRYTWSIATEQLTSSAFFARIMAVAPAPVASVTTALRLTNADAP
jgi:hypothetical protein